MLKKITYCLFLLTCVSCKPNLSEESLHSIIVSHQQAIVSQAYFNDFTAADYSNVQSLTKGIASLLIGIAIDQGHIPSVDEPIANYFPEVFATLDNKDKEKMTIKNLLNQTSGLEWKGYLEHEDWLASPDPVAYVLNKKLVAFPGKEYNYNSGATHLLSGILTKATGQSTLEFANEQLFGKLEIEKVKWAKRNDGHYDCAGLGLSMRPIDLVKIGQLIMGNGVYEGSQVVSQAWIKESMDTALNFPTRWGLRNSSHGYCWYAAKLDGEVINYGMGYGGQFIFMIPAKDLIIVSTQEHDTPDGLDQQIAFLKNQLPDLIAQFAQE